MTEDNMTRKEFSENDFFRGFLENNEKAIDAFFKFSYPKFTSYMKSHWHKNAAEIDDLYQDSIVLVFKYIKSGKLSMENLRVPLFSYMLGIGINKLREEDRRTHKKDRTGLVEKTPEGTERLSNDVTEALKNMAEWEEAEKEKKRLLKLLPEILKSLPERCREIMVLFYYKKLSCKDIALRLGFSNEDSVKTQKNKCRNKAQSVGEELSRI